MIDLVEQTQRVNLDLRNWLSYEITSAKEIQNQLAVIIEPDSIFPKKHCMKSIATQEFLGCFEIILLAELNPKKIKVAKGINPIMPEVCITSKIMLWG
jgi:hypothetical protein